MVVVAHEGGTGLNRMGSNSDIVDWQGVPAFLRAASSWPKTAAVSAVACREKAGHFPIFSYLQDRQKIETNQATPRHIVTAPKRGFQLEK